jgi:transcriptional regulator with XRE-family HTH domain
MVSFLYALTIRVSPLNGGMTQISKIDKYIIDRIKKRRKKLGITGQELSFKLGKAESYISQFEGPSSGKKFNSVMINEIAKALSCSPRTFWPEKPL